MRPRRTRARSSNDDNAIALIGEFNSGASAISIPITNEAGLLQVSPSNTALELTKDAGPDDKGAPEKYYPTGERTYGRVVPADHIQGSAQAEWMDEEGVTKLYTLDDKQVYGAGVAKTTGRRGRAERHRGRRLGLDRPEGAELPVARGEDR